MKIWGGLLAAGLDRFKIDSPGSAPRASEATEIRAVYQVWEAPQQEKWVVQFKDYMAPMDVSFNDVLFHFE